MSWREPRCGVYCIVNAVSGKRYVGSSKKIERRWASHLRSGLSGASGPLYEDMRAEGPEAFSYSILQECSADELLKCEAHWILRLQTVEPFGYNRASAGGGAPSIAMLEQMPEADRARWKESAALRGRAAAQSLREKRADAEYEAAYRASHSRGALQRERHKRARRAADPAFDAFCRQRNRELSLSKYTADMADPERRRFREAAREKAKRTIESRMANDPAYAARISEQRRQSQAASVAARKSNRVRLG